MANNANTTRSTSHKPADAGKMTTSTARIAPEIVGVDADGKKFHLSDYRGKVVLLDFWASY
jgi:cytochrome oxidase Cu insertion factor (SCO1/SenC/PrrC family)